MNTNKKAIWTLISVLLLSLTQISQVFAPALFEHYTTGDDSSATLYGTCWDAQTFTTETLYVATSVKLKMWRDGYPGTLNVSIRETSAGKPTGDDLTYGEIDANTFTTSPTGQWYEITFVEGVLLQEDIMYAIVARIYTGGGDWDNVHWQLDYTSPTYSGGTLVYSYTSGESWTIADSFDCMFEVWGEGDAIPLSDWNMDPRYTNCSYTLESTEEYLYLYLAAQNATSRVTIRTLTGPQLNLSQYDYVDCCVTGSTNAIILLRFFFTDSSGFDVVYWKSPTYLDAIEKDLSPWSPHILRGDVYIALKTTDGLPCWINMTLILYSKGLHPTYSNIGTNATEVNEVCEFSCLWEDETALSGYIFGWNGTGSFTNESWTPLSGTSAWANVSKTLPANPYIVTYQWWCNDTFDNWNTTGLQYLNVTECYIVARFKYSPLRPYINENMTFNGTYSVCSGTIDSYNWTFGDESSDTGSVVYHNYSTSGLYTVNLTISGVDLTDSFTLQVNVTDYIGPTACFTFSPSNPRYDTSISFNGSQSYDPDGTVQTYSWTFGDGNSSSGVTVTHTYNTDGEFTVTLNTTDDHSKTDAFSVSFNVTANTNPVAFFTYKPFFPFPNTPMYFYSDESSDSDGSISSYFWDFGDNQNSSTANPSHTYSTDENFNVTLTITDNDGGSDTYSRIVSVSWGVPSGDEQQIIIIEKEKITLLCEVYGVCSVSIDGFLSNYADVEVTFYLESVLTKYLNVTAIYIVKDSANITQFRGNSTFLVSPRQRENYTITFQLPLDSNFWRDIGHGYTYILHTYLQYISDGETIKSSEVTRTLKIGSSHGMLRWSIGLIIIGIVFIIGIVVCWEIYQSRKKQQPEERKQT